MSTRMTFSRSAPALLASVVLALAVVVPACASDDDLGLTPGGADAGAPETGIYEDGGAPIVIDGGGPESECGNRKLEDGEACDDGNTVGNDGCSADCKTIESAFEGDTCPGTPITLRQEGSSLRASVTGTTKGAYNHGGTGCGGGSAPDVVYTFTPSSSGKAKVTLTADFQAMVAARTSCEDPVTEASCADIQVDRGGKTTMEVPVFGGMPIFLFVDGYAGSTGNFTLEVEVTNAVCGNGVGELPEECDDGNTVSGDGCSATCTFEGGGVIGACPGQPFVLSGAAGAVRKVGFSGNTLTQGTPTLDGTGVYYDGSNNTVYALKSDIDGSAHVELTAGFAKASVHARSECADGDSQIGAAAIDAPGTTSIDFPVRAGQWFYVAVDGLRRSTRFLGGPYALSVAVTPASCGNGVLDGNEECDDAKAADGIGCTAACKRVPLSNVDTCPGHELELKPRADGSQSVVVSGTTVGLNGDVRGCQVLGDLGVTAPDAVYRITPSFTGLLSGELVGPFNASLSVLDSCVIPPTDKDPPIGDRSTVLACSYAVWIPDATTAISPYYLTGAGSAPKSIRAPVIAGQTYYVVVDGMSRSGSKSAGPYKLDLTLTAPVCGNGIVEGTETCDDGGTDGGDGCSATCALEPVTSRDTCATAEAVTLVPSTDPLKPNVYEAIVRSGTTNLASDQNFNDTAAKAGACWARGADAYFKIVAPVGGVLRASAKSDAFDVILGFRSPTCPTGEQKDAPLACTNAGPKGVTEELIRPVNQGDTILVVVDTPLPDVLGCMPGTTSYAADCELLHERGRFTLDLAITPSGCGDGFLVTTSGEECDDGNTANGDGCSSTCTSEALPNVDTCPGYPVALTASGNTRRGKVTVNTALLTSNDSGACGGNAKDGVLRITPDMSGNLTARATTMAGVTLYARSVCGDASTEFPKASSSSCVNVVHDTVSFPVTKGQDYFVFVDGLDGAVGAPSIDILVTP